jgi:MinD superfamily P-loop ATPase
VPKIDLDLCDFCGGCAAVCPENAITVYFDLWIVDNELCNECLVCKKVCPMNAIQKKESLKY